jgi:hypothetical protein
VSTATTKPTLVYEPDKPDETWRTDYTALVLRVDGTGGPHVLLVPAKGGPSGTWDAVRWSVPERRNFTSNLPLIDELRERTGLDTVILRRPQWARDDDARVITFTLIFEVLSGGAADEALPAGARWCTAADLPLLNLADPTLFQVIEDALVGIDPRNASPNQAPWAFPGWFSRVAGWIENQLTALGRPPTGPVLQNKAWSISCVLEVPTATGPVFLKAPCAHFRAEAVITQTLANAFPDRMPVILAAEPEEGWLLLEDFGDVLRSVDDLALRERPMTLIAEMHHACTGRVDELLSLGFADRRLHVLRAQLDWLFEDPFVTADTPPEQLARAKALRPRFQALCDELAACGVPETMIHSDLHPGNVALKDGRITIFDWTDGAIAHPFLDLVTYLPDHPIAGVPADEACDRMRDLYLATWLDRAPRETLLRAFDIAQILGSLHQVVTYVFILRNIAREHAWQWTGDIADWLAEAEKALADLSE